MHGVQAISRKGSERSENPQRLYARPIQDGMRQSDLHGDMQSQTETSWPLIAKIGSNTDKRS
jgi:hypothetical protein